MGIPCLILGESGSGKSASLRNFEPEDVSIFNVAAKPLPFRKKLPMKATSDYGAIILIIYKGKIDVKGTYKSRVYTDRPPYADFEAPAKFQAIQSIIAKHLTLHPNAICSYSGGADSDILIDLIEQTRKIFNLKPVKYAFFNTGLEMQATKRHVKEVAERYGVEITEYRPKTNNCTADDECA